MVGARGYVDEIDCRNIYRISTIFLRMPPDNTTAESDVWVLRLTLESGSKFSQLFRRLSSSFCTPQQAHRTGVLAPPPGSSSSHPTKSEFNSVLYQMKMARLAKLSELVSSHDCTVVLGLRWACCGRAAASFPSATPHSLSRQKS